MAKNLMVIRVMLPAQKEFAGRQVNASGKALLVECFRYAGLVNVIHDGEEHVVKGLPEGMLVFDVFPPKAAYNDSLAWARMNADRMRSFGFEAEAVVSGTEAGVYVIKDTGAGWVCYNGIEGWRFTTISNNAREFIGPEFAHRVIDAHYPGQRLQVIPRVVI